MTKKFNLFALMLVFVYLIQLSNGRHDDGDIIILGLGGHGGYGGYGGYGHGGGQGTTLVKRGGGHNNDGDIIILGGGYGGFYGRRKK